MENAPGFPEQQINESLKLAAKALDDTNRINKKLVIGIAIAVIVNFGIVIGFCVRDVLVSNYYFKTSYPYQEITSQSQTEHASSKTEINKGRDK